MESLYQISEELQNFNFEINEETGEVLNIEELNNLKMAFNEKAENIIKYIKNIDAEINALKNEENVLKERRQAKEKKVESLKEYLGTIMRLHEKTKLEFTSGVASFRKSNVVEVDEKFAEWAEKNAEFLLKYEQPKADKTAIKDYLKDNTCEFARIVEKQNLGVK